MAEPQERAGEQSDESKQKSLFQRAKRVYRVANFLKNVKNIGSFLLSKTGVATAVGLGGAAVGTVAATSPGLLGLEAGPPPKPAIVKVATKTLGGSSLVFPIEGRDADERKVLFDLVVLSKKLSWVRGSDSEILLGERRLAKGEIVPEVFGAELRGALSAAKEVIAVGLASVEGDEATETERATRRAATAAEWIAGIVPKSLAISALNLGQFRNECVGRVAGDTAWQRPLMVIAVRDRQPKADVREALANALTGKSNLPSPACYTRFDMRGVR